MCDNFLVIDSFIIESHCLETSSTLQTLRKVHEDNTPVFDQTGELSIHPSSGLAGTCFFDLNDTEAQWSFLVREILQEVAALCASISDPSRKAPSSCLCNFSQMVGRVACIFVSFDFVWLLWCEVHAEEQHQNCGE